MAELFGSILREATGRASFNLPGPPLISENRGGVYRRSMDVAVGPTGRVHYSLGHCHEGDLAVGVSRRRADGPFHKFGLQSTVWVQGFHDLDLLASRQCFLVQAGIRLTARVPAQSEQTRPSPRRNGPWVTDPALWVVRAWMLQCIGVADTSGGDCRFRGEQRAWSFTPPGVERNKDIFSGNLGQTKQFTDGPL